MSGFHHNSSKNQGKIKLFVFLIIITIIIAFVYSIFILFISPKELPKVISSPSSFNTISIVPMDDINMTVGETIPLTISHGGFVPSPHSLLFSSTNPDLLDIKITSGTDFTFQISITAAEEGSCRLFAGYGGIESNSLNITICPPETLETYQEEEETFPVSQTIYTFIVNKSAKVIHRSGCSHAPENGTITTLYYEWIDDGYCKCNYCFSSSSVGNSSLSSQNFSPDTDHTQILEHSLPIGSYKPGQYKVGIDIPSGKYIVFPTDDRSGYFSVSSDSNGKDIIFNDNFDGNSILEVVYGEYLELSHCYAVPYSPSIVIPNADSGEAFLVVGVHVSTGEHKIIATEDSGYYCIYNDLRQDDIESNDHFENSRYITLSLGQYLYLHHAKLIN